MTPPRKRALLRLGPWRSDAESEVAEELDFHFDETVRMLTASGMSRAAAEEEAHRRFGDRVRYQRELERRARSTASTQRAGAWAAGVAKDVVYAVRAFRRSPTFTAGVVSTLAVAIGAATAMVAIVYGVLLRPLPFPDADRIVRVFDTQAERGVFSSTSSPPTFLDWRERQRSFDALAAHLSARAAYTDVVPAEDLAGFQVSAEWFGVLGVQPMLGRAFTRAEEIVGNDRVVIVSYDFWQRYLDASPSAVGRTITLDGTPYEVVGVMPAGFAFPSDETAIWRPLSFDFDVAGARGVHYLYVIGRLRSAATSEAAGADLRRVLESLRESDPELLEGWDVRLASMHEWLVGDTRARLVIFLGAVALLVLVAAVNVTSMMLVRSIARARDMAVRAAMGAGRSRLVRQLVVEGMTITVAATVLGLLLGRLGIAAVVAVAPANLPRLHEAALSAPVVSVVVAIALLLGALLAGIPSIALSRARVGAALRGGGRTGTTPRLNRLRGGFVVSQIALAMLLTIGAGLLVRSFQQLTRVDPGYRTERAWTATVSVPGERYPADVQRSQFFLELVDRLAALPGVRSAAATTQLPLEFYGINFSFWRAGHEVSPSERPSGDFRVVTPSYFETMGIPLVRGRSFDRSDRRDAAPVVVVNQTLAARYFPNEDPIGQSIHISYGDESSARRIIGVVGDVKQRTLATPASAGYYLPLAQVAWSTMRLVVRSDVDPLSLTGAVRREVAGLDPLLPVRDVRTLEERFTRAVGQQRFSAFLLTLFAAIAGLVAASGIYSVTALAVAQRTREIGLRMALGAAARRVRWGVSASVIRLAVIGVVIAYGAAAAATRSLEGLLYGVSRTDAVTFAGAGLAFLLIASLGAYLPARRASSVDPTVALRAD